MNEIFPIQGDVAKKIWNNFERELSHKLKPLPKEEVDDIRLEILSHLYESALNAPGESEEIRLVNAIERLGAPDEYLTPLVADILLMQKTIKGHPLAIGRSLLNNAHKGFFLCFNYYHFRLWLFLDINGLFNVGHALGRS